VACSLSHTLEGKLKPTCANCRFDANTMQTEASTTYADLCTKHNIQHEPDLGSVLLAAAAAADVARFLLPPPLQVTLCWVAQEICVRCLQLDSYGFQTSLEIRRIERA